MVYKKPKIHQTVSIMPPVTANFAPPPVEGGKEKETTIKGTKKLK